MNLLVAGCGMVGAKLALRMCRMGHDVSVVDREEESFEKLGAAFTGLTFVGNIIDLDVLRRAGIEGCDAVAAVTNSDNVNVMISQIARDIFSIPRVLTRVYDPDRERIFTFPFKGAMMKVMLAIPCIELILAIVATLVPFSADEFADKVPMIVIFIVLVLIGEVVRVVSARGRTPELAAQRLAEEAAEAEEN